MADKTDRKDDERKDDPKTAAAAKAPADAAKAPTGTPVATADAKATATNAKDDDAAKTGDADRQFQRSEQTQADDKQRPVMAGQGTKIDNPLPPEHPGAVSGAQPQGNQRSAMEPQPEMRNEDRRSPPNRHVQTVRDQDRPQRRADDEANERHRTLRSEVTGKRIESHDVGDRGPDNLTGGLVTESRQTGAVVTNEQRAGCMPESSRRANENAEAEAAARHGTSTDEDRLRNQARDV